MASQVKCFEETHTAANLEPLSPGEFARIVIIEHHTIRLNLFSKENCTELSNTQSVCFLGRQ